MLREEIDNFIKKIPLDRALMISMVSSWRNAEVSLGHVQQSSIRHQYEGRLADTLPQPRDEPAVASKGQWGSCSQAISPRSTPIVERTRGSSSSGWAWTQRCGRARAPTSRLNSVDGRLDAVARISIRRPTELNTWSQTR
jgi:hypothetical protein